MFLPKIKKIFSDFSKTLYPEDLACAACGRELNETRGLPLCRECFEAFQYNRRFCRKCGVHLEDEADFCQICKDGARVFALARSACVYSGAARDMVISLKNGSGWLAKLLARVMAEKYPYGELAFDACLPVPVDKKRLAERGFNQSALIASELCKELNLKFTDGLVKIKPTEKQSLLSAKKRAENVKGAYGLSPSCPDLKNTTLLLIDDVLTTGATASECASVLLKGGASGVHVYTFAAGTGK